MEWGQGRYKIAYYQHNENGHLPLFSLFLHGLNYTTFVFQSIFTCYLTLHFGTEALSKRTNSPVGELLFLGEMDL